MSLYHQTGYYPTGPVVWNTWETAIVWMAIGASLAYVASTTLMALSLGRKRDALVLFDVQVTQNKV
jgi:hypothetical protein